VIRVAWIGTAVAMAAAPAFAQAPLLEVHDSSAIDALEVEAILRVELSGRPLEGFRFAIAEAAPGTFVLSATSIQSESRTMGLEGVEPTARARLLALMLIELARLASAADPAVAPAAPSDDAADQEPAAPPPDTEPDPAEIANATARAPLENAPALDAPSPEDRVSPLVLEPEIGFRAFVASFTAAPLAGVALRWGMFVLGVRTLGFDYANEAGSILAMQVAASAGVHIPLAEFGARLALVARGEAGYAIASGRSDSPAIRPDDFGGAVVGASIAPELSWDAGGWAVRTSLELGYQYGIVAVALGQEAVRFDGLYFGAALGAGFEL
jgi:hypothetical protein